MACGRAGTRQPITRRPGDAVVQRCQHEVVPRGLHGVGRDPRRGRADIQGVMRGDFDAIKDEVVAARRAHPEVVPCFHV